MLHAIDADIGWAIVKLAERREGADGVTGAPDDEPPDVALVPIGPQQFLIVVRAHEALASLPDVDLVPLGHGRAFLAFERPRTIEGLELALIDRLEDDTVPPEDRARFAALRDVLRSWRRDEQLVFHERSIVVVEQRARGRRRNDKGRGPISSRAPWSGDSTGT